MARPRITVEIAKNDGGAVRELIISMNPEGRDLLVEELQNLRDDWDHEHFESQTISPFPTLDEVPYEKANEVVRDMRVVFRRDEWDEEHFPHVLAEQPPSPFD